MYISVSDCGGCSGDEVERVDVYHRHVILLMDKQRPLLPPLIIHPSNEDPNTCQRVEKYQQNEACFEHHMAIANPNCIVNVSLLKFSDHKIQLVEKAWHLEVPENLEIVEGGTTLKCYQAR